MSGGAGWHAAAPSLSRPDADQRRRPGRLRLVLLCAVLAALQPVAAVAVGDGQAGAPPARPSPAPRTFPEFAGSWELDEQASTGRITATPGATVTFAISATEVTLTRTRKLPEQRSNPPDGTPVRQVFRLDGSETAVREGPRELRGRCLRVADALVFVTSESPRDGGFNLVTDAYTVDGDVLTARRQLVAIRAPGYIATMQEPSNNHPHTFIYRRAAAPRSP